MKTRLDLAGVATASIATEVAMDGGAPAKRIQLFPMGRFTDRLQRTYELKDEEAARAAVAASLNFLGATAMVIDYDHQSEFGAVKGVGGRAPAAGWVKNLIVEAGGIYADVDWTPAAAASLAAREYRYISPTFFHSKDGALLGLKSAALTNLPAFDLQAVASLNGDSQMIDLKVIAKALGLGEDADEATVLATASAAGAARASLLATASALGLGADADGAAIATAAATAKAATAPDPAKFVPIADLQAVQTAMASMQTQITTLNADKRAEKVDVAIAGGKLLPAQRDWALALASSNEPALDDFLAKPPAHALGAAAIEGGAKPAPGGDGLTDVERATASAMGITAEAFLASKKEIEA